MALQSGGSPHGCHGDKGAEPVNAAEQESEVDSSVVPVLDSEAPDFCRDTQLTVSGVKQGSSSSVPASEDSKLLGGAAVHSRAMKQKEAAKMSTVSSSSSTGQLEPSEPVISSRSSVEMNLRESEQEITSTSSSAPYELTETDLGIVDRTGVRTNSDSIPPPEPDTTVKARRLRRKPQILAGATPATSSGVDCKEAKSSPAGEVMGASGCAAATEKPTSHPSGGGGDSKAAEEAKPSLMGELNSDLLCEHGEDFGLQLL